MSSTNIRLSYNVYFFKFTFFIWFFFNFLVSLLLFLLILILAFLNLDETFIKGITLDELKDYMLASLLPFMLFLYKKYKELLKYLEKLYEYWKRRFKEFQTYIKQIQEEVDHYFFIKTLTENIQAQERKIKKEKLNFICN